MSVEKKSLISKRTGTKKAAAAKPEITKVASPKLSHATAVRGGGMTRTRGNLTRLGRY